MQVIRARSFLICAILVSLGILARNPTAASFVTDKLGITHPRPIYRAVTREKVVALTFDDGPDPRFTPRVLAILHDKGIHATFFVVGKNAEKYPNLVEAITTSGNVLGNHTYSHPDFKVESKSMIRSEVNKCDQAIWKITKVHTNLFRSPKGVYDSQELRMLTDMGYTSVQWAITVEHKASPTPKEMAARIVQKIEPGEIILAHDGRLDRRKTVEALPLLIDGLKKKGYRFATVPELLNPPIAHHYAGRRPDLKSQVTKSRVNARPHAT